MLQLLLIDIMEKRVKGQKDIKWHILDKEVISLILGYGKA